MTERNIDKKKLKSILKPHNHISFHLLCFSSFIQICYFNEHSRWLCFSLCFVKNSACSEANFELFSIYAGIKTHMEDDGVFPRVSNKETA